MADEIVRMEWVRDYTFLLYDRNNFPILMDQPMGANAADLLPMSLIGCSSYDVVAILKKQRQKITDLQVTAESLRDPEPPWRFRKIHIHYHVSGSGLNPEKVQKAIELAEQHYCGVYATLKDAIEISSDFEILET